MKAGSTLQKITRWDIVFLIFLATAGLLSTFWIWQPHTEAGACLEVYQNGTLIKTIPLDKDTKETISTESGESNTFLIQNGTVTMTGSDCGDHTCIRTGSIQKTGETIVCLPHRLVLRISTDTPADNSPDAVVH